MGNLIGHVIPGLGFFLTGLWHLFNHFKLHSTYLELILIMLGSTTSVSMELFVTLVRHQPLNSDFTIPFAHLRNFEHNLISISFFAYVAFALALDRRASMNEPARHVLTILLGSVALGQEFLLFRLHSIDHAGIECKYHLLLQVLILTSLSAALLGIYHPRSLVVEVMRSTSVMFQGLWLMTIGFMLWTPGLIPKGYYMNLKEDTYMVRCPAEMAQQLANSLVNVLFAWLLILVALFSMSVYLALGNIYGERVDYQSLIKEELESS